MAYFRQQISDHVAIERFLELRPDIKLGRYGRGEVDFSANNSGKQSIVLTISYQLTDEELAKIVGKLGGIQ